MCEVDSSRVKHWVSSASSTVNGLVDLISKVTVTVQWAGRPRRTRLGDMSIFRGLIPLEGKKISCCPALASAGLFMEVASDIDKIFGPSEAMPFGSKVRHAPQCVVFKVWCQGMCFMAWSVTETHLSEQGLLGQNWTQLVQHVHYVSLESIPVKPACRLAQICACGESLVHSGSEPGSTCVGWMPKRPGTLGSEAESPLGCVHAQLKKRELKQVSISCTSSC